MSYSTNTSNQLALSTEFATTKGQFQVNDLPAVHRTKGGSSKRVQNAVYAYIRAIRTLGRTKINTTEVADALSLPVAEVNGALSSLKKRGVRALNG
jgi:hypothetical protein